MRPDVGTQPEFRKTRPPAKYRYDDSLSPVLEWDGQNAARDRAEALIEKVWDQLAGDTSAPFPCGGEHRQIAVEVVDERSNELLVVRPPPA